MSPWLVISLIVFYFIFLVVVARLTGKGAGDQSFFVGDRKANWRLVAYGMVGASLSGVTFISVPGGVVNGGFMYMQLVVGFLLGYLVITYVLLPLYYKNNLTSIYEYLNAKTGVASYKLGAAYFFLSRLIGASFRLFLVAITLDKFVLGPLGIAYEWTVIMSVALIWIYTHKGGIKTIIWTDTLQTSFMLLALLLCVFLLLGDLDLSVGEAWSNLSNQGKTSWFNLGDNYAANVWWKGILGGMAITICMTGLDQDMMQKNLSCRSLKDAQKNMLTFSGILLVVNLAFLFLGGLLMLKFQNDPQFAEIFISLQGDLDPSDYRYDYLFPAVALESGLGLSLGIMFILGLIAAAYSSADSALTALTTSLCIDFFNYDKIKDEKKKKQLRMKLHIFVSVLIIITVIIFKNVIDDSVVTELFKAANYTYGPLLGLFLFAILHGKQLPKTWTIIVCLLVPIGIYFLNKYSVDIFNGWQFGFEMLLIHGLVVYSLLWLGQKMLGSVRD